MIRHDLDARPHPSHAIRHGLFFAAADGEGVLMDLAKDRYYGLAADSAAIWAALERGLDPEAIAAAVFPGVPDGVEQVMAQLRAWEEAGFFAAEPAGPGPDARVRTQPAGAPAAAGLDPERLSAAARSPLVMLRLVRAFRWSRAALRRHGPAWAVAQVQRVRVPESAPADAERALYMIARSYYASRRLIRQGQEDCLPRSLALVRVLRAAGIDAELCFGVRKFPFLAHAWVEANGRAVNDVPARLKAFAVLARF